MPRSSCPFVILVEGPSDKIVYESMIASVEPTLMENEIQIESFNSNTDYLNQRIEELSNGESEYFVVIDNDILQRGFDTTLVPSLKLRALSSDLEGSFPLAMLCEAVNELVGSELISEMHFQQASNRNAPRYEIVRQTIESACTGIVMPTKVSLAGSLARKANGRKYVPKEIGMILKNSVRTLSKDPDVGFSRFQGGLLVSKKGLSLLDGSSVTARSQGRIHVIDTASSIFSAITNGWESSNPTWDHSGTRVVYQKRNPISNKETIWTVNGNGSLDCPINSAFNVEEADPCWTSDGHLVFTTRLDFSPRIVTSNSTGAERRELTDIPSRYPHARLKDNLVVFCNLLDSASLYICNYSSPERNSRKICEMRNCYLPKWSPDGRYIAFVSEIDQAKEIFILNFADLTCSRLTYTFDYAMSPTWSRDSRYVIYCGRRSFENDLNLWVAAIDGTKCEQLTIGTDLQQPSCM